MAYHFSFCDNEVYSATDVNSITSRLVTAGVEDVFSDGVPYNLSRFNEQGALLYTAGTVPETVHTLKVTKGTEENTVTILPGTAFFKDGAQITIEAGGHTLNVPQGVASYVYLKNDLVDTNTCYPTASKDAPTGDVVLLAEIKEDGTILDRRTFARGKLPGYASNEGYLMEIHDTITVKGYDVRGTKTYDIGNNNYRFLLVYQEGTVSDDAMEDKLFFLLGIYCLETGKYFSVDCASSWHGNIYTSISELTIYRDRESSATATVTCADGKLTLDITAGTKNTWDTDLPITLYLF